MKCSSCGAEFDSRFCPNCGTAAPQKTVCANCGAEYESNFCPNCGWNAASAEQDAPAETPSLKKPYVITIGTLEIDVNLVIRVYGLGVRKIGAYSYISQLSGVPLPTVQETLSPIIDHHISMGEKTSILDGTVAQSELTNWEKAYKRALKCPESSPSEPTSSTNQPAPPAPKPLTKSQRIKENKQNAVACCPKCGSTSLTANKKGYGIVKGGLGAIAGGALTSGIGAAIGLGAGNLGSHKIVVTCMNCGHHWKP